MKAIRIQKRVKFVFALCSAAAFFVLGFLSFAHFFDVSAETIENDSRVEENSELKYFLSVKYDGVDRYGVESSEDTTATIYANTIAVSDKLPDGLTFEGFVTSSTGKFGAVRQGDESISCPGNVVDDTEEDSVDAGTWNDEHTEYHYHGLHYSELTRTVSFNVASLQAGCKLNIGIITRTPFLGDATRKDFYNTANGVEDLLSWNSNTVHVWMGRENARLYTVNYSYSGDVPSNAPVLPEAASYVAASEVSVANAPSLDGYTFSGWQSGDTTILDGKFQMPPKDVTFVGEFVRDESYKEYNVSYKVNGEAPASFILPLAQKYAPGETVEVDDSYSAGDIIDGYRFSGWTVNFLHGFGETFVMQDCDVEIVGSFEPVKYTVSYQIDGEAPDTIEPTLPAPEQYSENEEVQVAEPVRADGYSFSGWSRDDFVMPAEDVVIMGRFSRVAGTFAPSIEMKILNDASVFEQGETVNFAITVTNTAPYPIYEIMLQEKLEGASFISGDGYEVKTSDYAQIGELGANESIVVYANYDVTKNENAHFVNTVALVSAIAENNYRLADGSFEAEAEFDTIENLGPPIDIDEDDNPKTGSINPSIIIAGFGICASIAAVLFCGHLVTRRGYAKLVVKIFGGVAITATLSLGLLMAAKHVFAADEIPLYSASVSSSKFDFDNNESGAWKVTTSGAYVNTRDEIIYSYEIEANEKRDERPLDVVISVFNNEGIIGLSTIDYAHMLADRALEDSDNRVAVVRYTDADTPLGRDATAIHSAIDNENTRPHALLSGVDTILGDYTPSDDRRLVVIALGSELYDSTENAAVANASILRERYPDIIINYAQFEHWSIGSSSDVFDNFFDFADFWYPLGHLRDVYTFSGENATEALDEIINPSLPLNSISVESYINDEFFDFTDEASAQARGEAHYGQIGICAIDNESMTRFALHDGFELSYENGVPKVIFTVDNFESYRGTHKVSCSIFLKAKEGTYPNATGAYPVTKSQTVRAQQRDDANKSKTISEEILFTEQPTVKDRHTVSYTANQPSDCTVTGLPEPQEVFIFDTVEYAQNIRCEGYNLRALSVLDEDVTRYRGSSFRMPQKDVEIKASWSKVSIDKSMDGTLFEVKPAYLVTGQEFSSKVGGAISSFTRADSLPDSLDINDPKYLVSTPESENPVYVWYESNGYYRAYKYYTAANKIYANPDSSKMFSNASTPWNGEAQSFEFLSELDTSLVTNMSNMFGGYGNFDFGNRVAGGTDVLRYWDVSNVTDMSSMFYYDNVGDTSGLADWNTESLTNIGNMFNSAGVKDMSGLANWDTSKVTMMPYAFAYMKFENSDNPFAGTNWSMESLENMLCAFRGSQFKSLEGLESWQTSSLISMEEPFEGNYILEDISALHDWDVSSVNHMAYLFANDSSLTDISALENWNTESLQYLSNAFSGTSITNADGLARRLVEKDGEEPYYSWDVSGLGSLDSLFYGSKIQNVDGLKNWDVSNVRYFSYIFAYSELSDASGLINWDTSSAKEMSQTFRNTKLRNLHGLENWNISGLRDLNYTFWDSTLLEDISALENWDASGLTNMQYTFDGCINLTSLAGLENWNTSNITDLNGTFTKTGITNLDPLARKLVTPESGDSYYAWDTSAMTSLSSTFKGASSLSDISGISNWNIQPESLGSTFSGTGITSVAALRDWDVSNLTSINSMFENTSNLTSLSGLENWGDKLGNLRTASWTFANSGVEDATNLNSWVLPSITTYGKNNTFNNTPAAANGLLPSWY